MQTIARITVEVPVLAVGSGPSDYEALGAYVDALRKRPGLHMTLLHIGVLAEFARDVVEWTRGVTTSEVATGRTVAWLAELPVLEHFSGTAEKLIVLGGGGVFGLVVDVPERVHDYQVSLVQALHELLEELLVDNVDDFILSSPALGFRYPHWTPHVAVGRRRSRDRGPRDIEPLAVEFGASRIRNRQFLPATGSA